jgi:hypothetical protein
MSAGRRGLTRVLRWILPFAVALTLSCQFIIGLEDPNAGPAPAEAGASTDAGADAGIDVDPCNHVFPPPQGIDDDPVGNIGPLTFAAHIITVKGRIGWDAGLYDGGGYGTGFPMPQSGVDESFGFDLDTACTCGADNRHGGAPSCTTQPSQSAGCDLDGGVDNALASFYRAYGALKGGDPDTVLNINQSISNGNNTLLMQLTKYNGRANDNDVVIQVALSGRTRHDPASTPDCVGAGPRQFVDPGDPDSGGDWGPKWDGCDVWDIVHLAPPVAGYVVDHQLVVTGAATLPVLAAGTSFEVDAPVSVGVLVPIPGTDGGFTYEDGIFSGRAEAKTLMASLLSFKAHSADVLPACYTSTYVDLVKSAVCSNLDLRTSPSEDFFKVDGSPLNCNAASFVFGFRQERAVFGDVLPDAAIIKPCDDSGADLTCPGL